MKNKYNKITFLVLVLLGSMSLQAQTITLAIENAQITTDGSNDFYEADIMISATADYIQGSGQFFLDYNPAAFGTNISAGGGIVYDTSVPGAILGAVSGFTNYYTSFTVNDNTTSRVSYLWQQGISSGAINAEVGNNVTGTPVLLVHVKMQYLDSNLAANVCFNVAGPSFDDQFYTACGPATPALADCAGSPGAQLFDYVPDCTNATPGPLSVGVVDLNDSEAILLYPNPTKDSFSVKNLKSVSAVKIYNIGGKEILSLSEYNGAAINTSKFSSGLYLVTIESDSSKEVRRLIVE